MKRLENIPNLNKRVLKLTSHLKHEEPLAFMSLCAPPDYRQEDRNQMVQLSFSKLERLLLQKSGKNNNIILQIIKQNDFAFIL